jgi:hypothetical protein
MGDKSEKDRHKKAKQKHIKDDAAASHSRDNTEQQHHSTGTVSLPMPTQKNSSQ